MNTKRISRKEWKAAYRRAIFYIAEIGAERSRLYRKLDDAELKIQAQSDLIRKLQTPENKEYGLTKDTSK